MKNYLHRVVGLYPTRTEAESARDLLAQYGLAPDSMSILEPGNDAAGSQAQADSDDVLKEMLRDGAIGTAVGTLAGAIGTAALATANISLFIANPVLGTLAMLGWGASTGAIVGAVAGAENDKGDVSDLVKNALEKGHVALIAHTATEQETDYTRKIIGNSMLEPGPGASAL